MAELSENQEQDESADLGVDETPSKIQTEKEQRSHTGLWFGVVILLIVIGLAAGGYLLLQQIREKQEGLGGDITKKDTRLMELTKQITGYQSQLAAIQTQLTNLDAEISGKEEYFNKKLADFSQLQHQQLEATQKSLFDAITRIQRQLGKTRGDWLIADAEYLLSVANQRLHLTGDVQTTLEALEAADQRLRESGDAAVYKVREELTREISLVKKIKQPDIVGVYAKIKNLEENIDKLTLVLPFSGKGLSKTEPETQEQEQDSEEDNKILDTALESLEDLVTIRYTETPIKSILTAEEVYFIRQQLDVKLEMAKISLVQRNDVLFKDNIADAKQWLNKNFTQNRKTKLFSKELDSLAAVNLKRQFPDISKSLKMLRDITKLRLETDKALSVEKEEVPVQKEEVPVQKEEVPVQKEEVPVQKEPLLEPDNRSQATSKGSEEDIPAESAQPVESEQTTSPQTEETRIDPETAKQAPEYVE